MIRPIVFASLILSLVPVPGRAAPPGVVADIAPLHSIVAEVMQGVGEPDLLVQPGASPHHYSLRPSEAEALARADVVFWISEELSPWLETPLENLAGSARKVEMLELPGTVRHGFREGATFEKHVHADGEDHDGHEDHDDDHEAHEDHAGHEGEEAHHHHGDHDPHAWLDPVNAKVWAGEIAQVLAEVDPANAGTYRQNARAFAEAMDELTERLAARAEPLAGIRFIVFHDAYQYFEQRFGLPAAGAISLSDASDPGPARIREIQNMVADLGVTCVFTEPQYNPGLVRTVFAGSEVKQIGVMDPLGVDIEPGRGLYAELLNRLMTSLEQCR